MKEQYVRESDGVLSEVYPVVKPREGQKRKSSCVEVRYTACGTESLEQCCIFASFENSLQPNFRFSLMLLYTRQGRSAVAAHISYDGRR